MVGGVIGFPKRSRLLRGAEFDRVFRRRCRASDGVLLVYGCENGLEHPRLGLVVSRKVGGAVRRNRWKRLLREAFRACHERLPVGVDLAVIPQYKDEPQLDAVQKSLLRLAKRVAAKLRSPEK